MAKEASSAAAPPNEALPAGVEVEELYDGPVPGQVVSHPAQLVRPIPQQVPPKQADVSYTTPKKDEYPAAVMVALDVLSARLLGLVALVTGCFIWGFVVWDPNLWRVIAASAFSALVFLPIMVIYWKAGMTGEGS